jgi:hypothetical protein
VHAFGSLVGETDGCVGEAGGCEAVEVFLPAQGSGDAAYVGASLGACLRAEVVLGDHIADADPATGAEHAEHLGDYLRLVDRQVDDAVANHHIHRFIWQWDVLDGALEELDIGGAGLSGVGPGKVDACLRAVEDRQCPLRSRSGEPLGQRWDYRKRGSPRRGDRANLARNLDPDILAAAIETAGYEYKTREQGAATSVLVAASPLLEGITGRYFADCNQAPVVDSTFTGPPRGFSVAPCALDPDNARGRTWAWEFFPHAAQAIKVVRRRRALGSKK